MCGMMLAIILFVLAPFKFPVSLNYFSRFLWYTNFIFGIISYCSSSSCCCSVASSSASFSAMSFNLCRPYHILPIILLYNKEAVSPTLCSLSASASRVATTGADMALYSLEIVFLIQLVMFIYTQSSIKI